MENRKTPVALFVLAAAGFLLIFAVIFFLVFLVDNTFQSTLQWNYSLKESEKKLLLIDPERLDVLGSEVRQKYLRLKGIYAKAIRFDRWNSRCTLLLEPDRMFYATNEAVRNMAAYEKMAEDTLRVISNRLERAVVKKFSLGPLQGGRFTLSFQDQYRIQFFRRYVCERYRLEFRLVDEAAMGALAGTTNLMNWQGYIGDRAFVPDGFRLPEGSEWAVCVTNGGYGASLPSGWLILKTKVELDGARIQSAGASLDNYGRPDVVFRLTDEGAEIFKSVTENNIKSRLAIILDGKVLSAPVIQCAIGGGSGQITGNFSQMDTALLADALNSGELPLPLKIIEEKFE